MHGTEVVTDFFSICWVKEESLSFAGTPTYELYILVTFTESFGNSPFPSRSWTDSCTLSGLSNHIWPPNAHRTAISIPYLLYITVIGAETPSKYPCTQRLLIYRIYLVHNTVVSSSYPVATGRFRRNSNRQIVDISIRQSIWYSQRVLVRHIKWLKRGWKQFVIPLTFDHFGRNIWFVSNTYPLYTRRVPSYFEYHNPGRWSILVFPFCSQHPLQETRHFPVIHFGSSGKFGVFGTFHQICYISVIDWNRSVFDICFLYKTSITRTQQFSNFSLWD